MPSFAKVITIAVAFLPLASATSCDAGDTSCESRAREETTSLLQTKSVVQHGTPAKEEHVHDLGLASSHSKRKKNEDECAARNGIAAGDAGATTCFCPLGYDCGDKAGMLNMVNPGRLLGISTKCKWSPPKDLALEKVMDKRADTDWGQWYFDRTSCTTCACADTYAKERALNMTTPAEQQVASLANLIYQDVGCPNSPKAVHSTFWTTASGWKLASYVDNGEILPVCKNTRQNEDMYWSMNKSTSNSAAHDNFALFINTKGNPGGIKPKTCVLAIEGTTFNGYKNWKNDATTTSSPWCGMNVQEGFKTEIMQFLGKWGIVENGPLVGKPEWDPHYTKKQYDADQNYPRDSIIDKFTEVVKKDCSELWVTGHSLGGAMAEMFAMCWNKRQSRDAIDKVSQIKDLALVSKVYTFGAPSAFDPYLIPAAQNGWFQNAPPAVGANKAVPTTWTTCFGGKRFFNMNTDADEYFDPVPTIATELGWMHLPYAAEQLGQADKTTTGCGSGSNKVPEGCPVCQIPAAPEVSTYSRTKHRIIAAGGAAATAAAVVGTGGLAAGFVIAGAAGAGAAAGGKVGDYAVNGADLHSMGIYEDRLAKDFYKR